MTPPLTGRRPISVHTWWMSYFTVTHTGPDVKPLNVYAAKQRYLRVAVPGNGEWSRSPGTALSITSSR